MMEKFIGDTVIAEGSKHAVVPVPVEFLSDEVLPLGSRILFTKISSTSFHVEIFNYDGIAKNSPPLEASISKVSSPSTKLPTTPQTNINSPVSLGDISPSPKVTPTIRHRPVSNISRGILAARQHVAGKENPTAVKVCGKAKVAISFPSKFVEMMPSKAKIRLVNDAGMFWDVSWSKSSKGFVGGWAVFAHDHALKETDVLAFELLDPFIMNFHIFEENGYEKDLYHVVQRFSCKRPKLEANFEL